MLVDGIRLLEGSDIDNLTVGSGDLTTQNALTPTEGEVFYRTDIDDFQVYDGSSWVSLGTTTDLSSHANNTAIHLTSAQNTLLDGLNVSLTSTHLNYSLGLSSNIQDQIDLKLPLSGGSLTGTLSLNGNPTSSLHAATKFYVDNEVANKANISHNHDADYVNVTGDTMSGSLFFDNDHQRISFHDGYSDMAICAGITSTEKGQPNNNSYLTSGSGATRIRLDYENVDGAVSFEVAPIGVAGDDLSLSNTIYAFTPTYVSFAGQRALNVANPIAAQDAATKNYVDAAVAAGATDVAVLSGTIAYGGTIPLPAGYVQAECKWMVSFANTDSSQGPSIYGSRSMRVFADANRVVTCQIEWYDGVTYSWGDEDANYIIIGVK